MIGKHECKEARDTDLKAAIAIGLDEAMTALEEAIHDLNDGQVRAFPIKNRNNIAWIVMHTLQNLDTHAITFQGGKSVMVHDARWDWECPRPTPGQSFPAAAELLKLVRAVRAVATETLASAGDSDLRSRRNAAAWWEKSAADSYMRTIFHTMAHVRQIWLLRGALGLTDGTSWPQQHWA